MNKRFWVEVANTTYYLINRCPSSTIGFDIPNCRWLGKEKLDYSYLKPFGCIAFVHQDKGKFNPRGSKYVFLGYPMGTNGFRLWSLNDKRL